MYSSGNVKTDYIDPHVNIQGKRTEFHLNSDSGYYSNLRIVNLGANIANKNFNKMGGVYSLVKHAYLYDGKKEIDSLRFANRYLAFANCLNSNDVNVSMNRKIVEHAIGFELGSEKEVKANFRDGTNVGTTALSERAEGVLDCRKLFPILNGLLYLDTSMMKNLRVVIEWESDSRTIFDETGLVYTVVAPILVADEVMDMGTRNQLSKSQGGVAYNAIEHDAWNVAANLSVGGDGAGLAEENSQSNKIEGFNNKYVSRVLISKAFSDKSKYGSPVLAFGDLGSLSQHKEKLACRVNGENLFSGDGIEHEGYKAKLLAMTYNQVNLAPYTNLEAVGTDDPNGNSVHRGGTFGIVGNKQDQRTGSANWIGFSIEDRIRDLNFTYKRTKVKDTRTVQKNNEALDIHIYCEVQKTFSKSGMDYEIKYV